MAQSKQEKIIMIRIKKGARGMERKESEKALGVIKKLFPNSQSHQNTVALLGDEDIVKRKINSEELLRNKKLKLEVNVRPLSADVQEGKI